MKKKYKIITINALKIILTIVPFVWIASKLDIDKLWPAITAVSWWTIPALFLGNFSFMFMQGIRWWILLRAFCTRLSFKIAISSHFSSFFYSMVFLNGTTQQEESCLYF
jgi:uncharacterized membrane protein YbhN (UPF0104 family)